MRLSFLLPHPRLFCICLYLRMPGIHANTKTRSDDTEQIRVMFKLAVDDSPEVQEEGRFVEVNIWQRETIFLIDLIGS